MSPWLEPLRSALDCAPGKATFFFRDVPSWLQCV